MMMSTAPLSARETRVHRVSGGTVGLTPRGRNPLLVKDDVGRGKPSCYDLPDDAFPYGRAGNQDFEGAREVSMRWVSHAPSRGPEEVAPDFVRLQKKAAGHKVANAKDLKHFRREYDLNDTSRSGGDSARSLPPQRPLVPSDVIPGFTYGRKVRPSTPIHEVVSNRFGERAEMELQRFNQKFQEHRSMQQAEVRKIPLTTASRGHASAARKAAIDGDEKKELFKLSKFQRAKPQVDTGLRKPPRHQYQEDPDHPSWDPRPQHGLANDYDDRRAGRDSHQIYDDVDDIEEELRFEDHLPTP